MEVGKRKGHCMCIIENIGREKGVLENCVRGLLKEKSRNLYDVSIFFSRVYFFFLCISFLMISLILIVGLLLLFDLLLLFRYAAWVKYR